MIIDTDVKFSVISPIGGYGNYIRWLLLLDNQFSFNKLLKIPTEEKYNIYKGVNWPAYSDWALDNFLNVPEEVIDDINNHNIKKEYINFTSIDNKIEFIKTKVFPLERTYHNWLSFEWAHRILLNNYIFFDHTYQDSKLITLLVTIDPTLSYKNYVKFNINLNTTPKEYFMKNIEIYNENCNAITKINKNTQILDVSILYQPELDRDWYQQLIKIFGFNDNYAYANYIHSLWYAGQKRAEQDIIKDMINLYGYKDK